MIRRITILILLALTTLAYGQDRQADSLILVQVYNQLDGPNWNSPDNWLTAAPLEEWKGITVTNDRVTNLSIISQNPTGTLATPPCLFILSTSSHHGNTPNVM